MLPLSHHLVAGPRLEHAEPSFVTGPPSGDRPASSGVPNRIRPCAVTSPLSSPEPPLARSNPVTWALCAGKGGRAVGPAAWAPSVPGRAVRGYGDSGQARGGWVGFRGGASPRWFHHLPAFGLACGTDGGCRARPCLSLGPAPATWWHWPSIGAPHAHWRKEQASWTLSGSQFRPPRHPALPGRPRIKGAVPDRQSLRKRGINSEALLADLDRIALQVNEAADALAQRGEIRCSRPVMPSSIPATGMACWRVGRSPPSPCGTPCKQS